MKILIIGAGGREHALGWKIAQSKKVKHIYFAPGNAGTAQIGENIPIKVEEIRRLAEFATKNDIGLTVVGPEVPLSLGITDYFKKKGLVIFGVSKAAAKIETSKVFAKNLMKKYKIPTADFRNFTDYRKAKKYLKSCVYPKVLKADGLAAGKGVIICKNKEEAQTALKQMMVDKIFSNAANRLVIEDYLDGVEASVMCFTDGVHIVPISIAQDHKTIYENNKGPNTGGMGTFAPSIKLGSKTANTIIEKIVKPVIQTLKKMGHPYQGVLYTGLMVCKDGPKVLEFNARFGDPETQPQMMLLASDIVPIMLACAQGKLPTKKLKFYPGYSVCVVIASGGYPGEYKKGIPIEGLPKKNLPDVVVFHAGTKLENGKVLTDGGRVLGVTVRAFSLTKAVSKAYKYTEKIKFNNMQYRRDIGAVEN